MGLFIDKSLLFWVKLGWKFGVSVVVDDLLAELDPLMSGLGPGAGDGDGLHLAGHSGHVQGPRLLSTALHHHCQR